jgi:hypothetical protein
MDIVQKTVILSLKLVFITYGDYSGFNTGLGPEPVHRQSTFGIKTLNEKGSFLPHPF